MQANGTSSDMTCSVKLLANENSIFLERTVGFTVSLSWLIFQIKSKSQVVILYMLVVGDRKLYVSNLPCDRKTRK